MDVLENDFQVQLLLMEFAHSWFLSVGGLSVIKYSLKVCKSKLWVELFNNHLIGFVLITFYIIQFILVMQTFGFSSEKDIFFLSFATNLCPLTNTLAFSDKPANTAKSISFLFKSGNYLVTSTIYDLVRRHCVGAEVLSLCAHIVV